MPSAKAQGISRHEACPAALLPGEVDSVGIALTAHGPRLVMVPQPRHARRMRVRMLPLGVGESGMAGLPGRGQIFGSLHTRAVRPDGDINFVCRHELSTQLAFDQGFNVLLRGTYRNDEIDLVRQPGSPSVDEGNNRVAAAPAFVKCEKSNSMGTPGAANKRQAPAGHIAS